MGDFEPKMCVGKCVGEREEESKCVCVCVSAWVSVIGCLIVVIPLGLNGVKWMKGTHKGFMHSINSGRINDGLCQDNYGDVAPWDTYGCGRHMCVAGQSTQGNVLAYSCPLCAGLKKTGPYSP